MSALCKASHRRTDGYYGALAFASVVVAAFATSLTPQRYYVGEIWVIVTFASGALYATLGVLYSRGDQDLTAASAAYYTVQCLLLTLIVFGSPSRGFIGIVVLPLVSQAIFELRAPWAVAVGLYLFAVVIGVWAFPFGWWGVSQSMLNYSTAFIFTIAFTLVTKQALIAREREAKLRHEVEEANRQLRDHAAQMEELATTRERNRVAREIHDGVGHFLTVVKTQLDAAAALLPDNPLRAREVVLQAAKLSAEALDDVRESVTALRTDAARVPLPQALDALATNSDVPLTVRVEGTPRALAPAVEHALFRSAQEGVTNIRKHAAATAAEILLDFRRHDAVALVVADNGRGVAAHNGNTVHAGFGLRGMRERIEVLGGRVESGNQASGGFALKVEVPA